LACSYGGPPGHHRAAAEDLLPAGCQKKQVRTSHLRHALPPSRTRIDASCSRFHARMRDSPEAGLSAPSPSGPGGGPSGSTPNPRCFGGRRLRLSRGLSRSTSGPSLSRLAAGAFGCSPGSVCHRINFFCVELLDFSILRRSFCEAFSSDSAWPSPFRSGSLDNPHLGLRGLQDHQGCRRTVLMV
jgi:hypothetical protein